MPRYAFDKPRLFLASEMADGRQIAPERDQAHYLQNVLRLRHGAQVLVFNGRDGEWLAMLRIEGRKSCVLELQRQVRAQTPPGDLHYLFAPLKHARLDYMAQKATEMGASALIPVITRRTQATRVNLERLRANAIEAAEQCGVLSVPEVGEARRFHDALAAWPNGRLLVFCDEDAGSGDPVAALRAAASRIGVGPATGAPPLAVLIGPEGGFDDQERRAIRAIPEHVTIALGPRILRADTAAVAALTAVQIALGDWR